MAASITLGSSQEDKFAHGPPQTLEDALREHGIIDQSKQSLIAALQDSDREVRGIAANKLAADGDLDATPAIESALSREQNLNTPESVHDLVRAEPDSVIADRECSEGAA